MKKKAYRAKRNKRVSKTMGLMSDFRAIFVSFRVLAIGDDD